MRLAALTVVATTLCLISPSNAEDPQPVASLPRVFGKPVADMDIAVLLAEGANKTPRNEHPDPSKVLSLGETGDDIAVRDVSAYEPKVVASGDMIKTKGIYFGRGALFIADTGKNANHNEPGKVWRFDLKTKELSLFYSSPDLITPKWLFYYHGATPAEDKVIVSDYGQETAPRQPGTGVGAKVISIPVNVDGTAGNPAVLHAGPPFQSPEGVTVIGKTVILADWAAGAETARPEVPDDRYRAGLLFAFPLEGGEPRVLFPEKKWVTLIGACQYSDKDGNLYLRMIDIDGGRIDTAFPTFPRSGVASYWTAKVLSEDPLVLGPIQRMAMTEDVPLHITLPPFNPAKQKVIARLTGTDVFDGDTDQKVLSAGSKPGDSKLALVHSSMDEPSIKLDIIVSDVDDHVVSRATESFVKAMDRSAIPMDNKHAGARRMASAIAPPPDKFVISGSADGTTRALFLFPPKGGTPAILWKGAPFVQPMGVQFSDDNSKIYVTDQAAGKDGKSVLFELAAPPLADLKAMFPEKLQ